MAARTAKQEKQREGGLVTVPRDDASRLNDFNDFNDGSGDGDDEDKGRGGDGTKRSRKKSARRPEIHVRLRGTSI